MNATHCIIPAESVHSVSKLFFFSLQVAVEKWMVSLYHLPYSVSPLSMKQKRIQRAEGSLGHRH
jgi:hypothetical protein